MYTDRCHYLYHRGFLHEAIEEASRLDPATKNGARGIFVVVQALMEMGRFAEAKEFGSSSAENAPLPEATVLRTQSAFAGVMFHPSARTRQIVREELRILADQPDTYSQAMTARWKTRLVAFEIALFIRPITQTSDVISGFEESANLFLNADCTIEAYGELLRAADYALKGPPPDAEKARKILNRVRKEAGDDGDLPSVARAALALAEIDSEQTMTKHDPHRIEDTALQSAVAPFDEAMTLFHRAEIVAGEATVRAALGRKLMRYGFLVGVEHLSAAAELWEKSGHASAADGAWRELHLWHYHNANREDAEALEEKLSASTAIQGKLSEATAAVQHAQAAFASGDFAEAVETSKAAQQADLEPGQEAALLLIETSALNGRGARAEAEKSATRAVELLRPAEPCIMLGDAIFQLGDVQVLPEERFRLWEEAAQIDLACGFPRSASQRYANIAEALSQSGADATLPDGRTVTALFQRAEALAGNGNDLESLVLRGNLAQRQGVVAFRSRDLSVCGEKLTEAETFLRRANRIADLAFTLSHQGLALFQVSRNRHCVDTFRTSIDKLTEAGEFFRRMDLLGEQFRMERLAGAASWEAGNLSIGNDQQTFYNHAKHHMEEAGRLMDFLRRGRQEKDLFARQSSLDQISAEMEPFLEEAFRFHLNILKQPSEALSWLEKRKARGLLDSITSQEISPPPDLDLKLLEEERELETERSSINENNYSARKRWKALTHRLESLWQKMATNPKSAAYGALRLGLPMDWVRWRQALKEQESLPEALGRSVLSVHFVWPHKNNDPIRLIACKGDWDIPQVAELSTSTDQLQSFVDQCFGGEGRSFLGKWLEMAGGDSAWCERFSSLIAPLEGWTKPDDIILLIPHGPLHSVPLNALLIDGQPLAERNALSFAPSAAIMMACWQRQKEHPGRQATVIGCPNPGGGFPSLPRADEEATFVANLLGTSAIIENSINPADFRSAICDTRVIHFAGHAVEKKSGWDSGLQIGQDNTFTSKDFFQTPLSADLVTLSGCRTARSRNRVGDEMLGLIPSLLYAGASSILASQWEASDDATEALMSSFYQKMHAPQPMSKADALRQATISVRARFPNFHQWAVFTLHGDWK